MSSLIFIQDASAEMQNKIIEAAYAELRRRCDATRAAEDRMEHLRRKQQELAARLLDVMVKVEVLKVRVIDFDFDIDKWFNSHVLFPIEPESSLH